MREINYLNLDLLLERAEDGYHARVLASPSGETAVVRFQVPFSELELENFLLKVGRPRRQATRGIGSLEAVETRRFGGRLFETLFREELRRSLDRSLDSADSQNMGLRIRLRLGDVPELADLPWEYLYDRSSNRFLCLSEWTPIVRYLDLPQRVRPLAVAPPLRVLVLISSPTDYQQLDVEREWAKLTESLDALVRGGRVELERLEAATLRALQQRLRRGDWHVLHFIGHGGFDAQAGDGVLVLQDQTGRGHWVSGQDLGVLLHDHRTLRLAVLNACEGARSGRTDPFAGTAQSLVQQGIPAVLAMQFEITDEAAIVFSQVLYEAVSDGYPLDAATAEARKAVHAEPNPVEWATPVLYLRAPDGRIFDLVTTPNPLGAASGAPTLSAAQLGAQSAPDQSTSVQPPAPTPRTSPTADRDVQDAHSASQPTAPGPLTDPWQGLTVVRQAKRINAIAFSPDGRWLATGSDDKTARVWELPNGHEVTKITHRGWGNAVNGVAFSPDGTHLATASVNETARVWELPSGREVTKFTHEKNGWVYSVAFSPDGHWLATGSGDKTARVWELPSGREVTKVTDKAIRSVAFSPDGHWLATSGEHKTARVWELPSGREVTKVNHGRFLDYVWSVAFSPDGRWLATGGTDKTARIWELPSGREVTRLPHDGRVNSVAFSPDGRWLATGGDDKTARMWAMGEAADRSQRQ